MRSISSLLLLVALTITAAFVPLSTRNAPATPLNMVVGPKQALAMERMKDAKKTEQTIQGLMKTKKLTREQAEKRYGEFLVDPDGFALRASEANWKAQGYKNWEDAAIGRSDDPEATRERIQKFKREKSTQANLIIGVGLVILLYLSSHKQVPTMTGQLIDVPTTNPYRANK